MSPLTTHPPTSSNDSARDHRAAEAIRTANRLAARAATPRLERNAIFELCCLEDLRIARGVLDDEEIRASHWRRIIKARLRVVCGRLPARGPVADFRRVLSDARATDHRLAVIAGGSVAGPSTLPDLAEIWWRKVELCNVAGMDRLELDLEQAHAGLSAYLLVLQRRRNQVNNEIIVRYREEPSLALSLLPPAIPPSLAEHRGFPRGVGPADHGGQ